jgi:hypothetical protein
LLLLEGITGFPLNNDLAESVSTEFKQVCYSISRQTHGKLLSFEKPHESQNFYKAELEWKDEKLFILLNGSYPIVAFASNVEPFNITFIDHPIVNEVETFTNIYTIAVASELEEPVYIDERAKSLVNENKLNKQELSQLFYWKPKTVGEIVFNFWD